MMLLEKVRTRYVGSRDDLGGIVSTLADTLTQRGARAFRRSVLAAAQGDFSQGWSGVSIGIEELQGIYAEAFRRAGVAESTVLRGFEIDMTHPRVRSHLRRRSANLVTGIDNEVRNTLRRALADGTIEGLQPEELAARIRGIVGLSTRDAQAVDNLRAGMRAQGVPAGTANRRAKEYADRLLDARALIIARTEITDAIETGRQELWEQAVEAGLLARKHIWRIWVTHEDDRVCPICRPLHGSRARLGGTFSKGGQSSLRPPAHPNCRCSVEYEIARFRIKKHYGPGPHPGTGTPQKIHGQPAGSTPIGINEDDFVSNVGPAVRPYLFSFETKSGATYHSVITDISDDFSDDRVTIEGEIQADDGEFIGAFQREIDLFDMTVQNLSFKVDPKFQAEGIGLTWLTLVENQLHREGIERMFVQAVAIGRYAWAKHGYDWDGSEGAFWWASMKDYKPVGSATVKQKTLWSGLVSVYEGGDHIPEPWEIASIEGLGKKVMLEGPTWNGVKDTTIDYEAVTKADSAAYNRLLHQWVADGKAGLIETDDPSWFEAVANLE